MPEAKKMPVAEEVFIIMRELTSLPPSGEVGGGTRYRTFRWRDWKAAWNATSVRWRFAGFMSAGIALKTQVYAGTIFRVGRGLYIFAGVLDLPQRPLYAPGSFRPYAD